MTKPWLTQYPAGVPAEIDMQRFGSLVDMLTDKASVEISSPVFCAFACVPVDGRGHALSRA